ncbi:MAG: hypothetical protein LKF96_08555 [Treponema sp.]|jgi:hypothetical protein|nr:hypothetical protein [Treponema sp.]
MADSNSFLNALTQSLEQKTQWFDTTKMPEILNHYRLLHTCVKNLYEVLVEKSLITEDPYKHDKKISDIVAPADTPFNDNERSLTMGTRFSDYESMIDFLCNYYKFSVMNLTIENIKKLVALNASFGWSTMSMNSSKPNTRALSVLLNDARKGASSMTVSLINDSITKCAQSVKAINGVLKDVTDLQREVYKGSIRKNLFYHPEFNSKKAEQSPEGEQQEIKRLYPAVMGKSPYYGYLIDEIIKEDHASDKEKRRTELLAKLTIVSTTEKKQKQKIDIKEIIMESIRILGGSSSQLDVVVKKMEENHDILEAEQNSFFDKLGKILRKAFNIPDPPVTYEIIITDPVTQTQQRKNIDYREFLSALVKRSRSYAGFSITKSPGYKHIESYSNEKILDFVNKQLSECQQLLITLSGIDDFFKNSSQPEDASKIKGLKMEISSLKNTIVKANQKRAEYTSYLQEEEQMKKLGITDGE